MSFPQDEMQPPMDPAVAMDLMQGMDLPDSVLEREIVGPEALLPARPHELIDFTVKLSPEERSKLGIRLTREIESYRAVTERRRENLSEWRAAVEMLPNDADGPWPNSSALRAAMTATTTDQHTTRLNQQIVSPDPPFAAVARKPEAIELAPSLEEALTSLLDEAEWQKAARDVHKELPIGGNVGLYIGWARETIRVPKLQAEFDEAKHQLLLQAGLPQTEAYLASVDRDPETGIAKLELAFEEKVVKDGLELRAVPFEDLIVLPANARGPQAAWGVGERVILRGMDLIRGKRDKVYFADAVDELLGLGSDGPNEDQEYRDEEQGIDAEMPLDEDPRYRSYECVQLAILDDLNDDGEEEWYFLTLHTPTRSVLRCVYLPYEHGRCPYFLLRYMPRVGQLWGQGIAERLAVLQDAATAAINQFFDLVDQMVAQAGNFFYDDSAGDFDKFVFQPGRPWRVSGTVQGILPMNFSQHIPAALQQLIGGLALLKEWADLLTGSSNPALGRESEGDKTLGEVQIVLSQGMQAFEDKAGEVALQWAQVWDMARWLFAQYRREESGNVTYRKTAKPDERMTMVQQGIPVQVSFAEIPADVLTADVDLVPAGLNSFADANTRTQVANFIGTLLDSHPITAGNLGVALSTLKARLQASRFPGWEALMDKIYAGIPALQQAMAVQQAAQGQQLEQGEQQLQQGEQQAQQQQMQGQMDLAGQAVGLIGQLQGIEQAGQPPNGKTSGNGKKPAGKK